jgi:DNA end-binding protein Ku
VPDEEVVKGYEYAKGQYVLLHPKEIDELKLEAKHTIDMARFVDEAEIDTRYWEKPYYLVPDGEEADEGYIVIRDALKAARKVAIGQLIMQGVSTWSASSRFAEDSCLPFYVMRTRSVPPSLILRT